MDLAWATRGAAWDLNQLRAGGLPARSFTQAFVAIKAQEIEQQVTIDLVSTAPAGIFRNLTGVVEGAAAGSTITFTAEFTGDGTGQGFDLLFVRPGTGIVLGSIPVTINNDYFYLVRAVDPDGDPLTYSLLEAPAGATINAQTGQLAWTPPAPGTYHFRVQVADGRGGLDVQDYDVTVTAGVPNRAPTITSAAPLSAAAGRAYTYRVTATDPDDDALAFYLTTAPAGMTIDRTTGVISWTPTAAQAGSHSATVRVLDGRGGQATQSFTLTVASLAANRAPAFTSVAPSSVVVGQGYRYAAVAIDADADPLTFDLPLKPEGMAVDPTTGVVTWVPAANQVGTHQVVLRVRDALGAVQFQGFEVTARLPNTKPAISSTPPSPAVVGVPYQYAVRAQDADNDVLTFALDAAPSGMQINSATGILTWTPALGHLGTQRVVITVGDGRGGVATQTFDLSVVSAAPNEPPTITSTPRATVQVGRTYFYQVQAFDPNSDPLTYRLEAAPAGMTLDATGLLTWTPTAAQFGASPVRLRVEDGRTGVATQSFTVTVVAQAVNQPPAVTSTPPATAVVERTYAYDPAAADPDGDPLVWQLDSGSTGMSIDPQRGSLRWTPQADQLGTHSVTLRVQDTQGASATQSFTITVRGVNVPPVILSAAAAQAAVGRAYAYAVLANDADGDALTFALTAAPAGMTIDGATGLIRWTPAAGQEGPQAVTVRVSDGQGGAVAQAYTVVVTTTAANQPPAITSTPPFTAAPGELYRYAVTALDPDGDAPRFVLVTAPAGMTIEAATGLVQWTPTAAQVGTHAVAVAAVDAAGVGSQQNYTVTVRANRAPAITSTPVRTVTAGLVYRYDLRATDPDGDALAFKLDAGPAGMTMDEFGRVTWATGIPVIGTYPVRLSVTDPRGASATQAFDLTVAPDQTAPRADVRLSANPVAVGGRVTVQVSATDNVAVQSVVLTLNGTPLALDAAGSASLTLTAPGSYTLTAVVTDAAGQTTTTTQTLTVFDPSDAEAPVVALTAPAEDAVLTGPVNVTGTASDANLLHYTLSVCPVGGGCTEFARNTTSVVNGVLGRLDPTILANDSYLLRLTARDAGGRSSTVERIVSVAGNLKLGEFQLAFVDLEVPVSGVPITVSRTYNSLQSATRGDFGFGWRLDYRNVDLRTSVPPSGMEDVDLYTPFRDGSRVYVTLPGGKREGFTFRPTRQNILTLTLYHPAFVADRGSSSKLTVPDHTLIKNGSDYYAFGVTGLPYNPDSGFFGGTYTLTTKEGVVYQIDAASRQLTSVTDANNNRLTFSQAGVVSSAGVSVAFSRDPAGRIAAVTDPDGKQVRYEYDARGDLVRVVDRDNAATRFVYSAARAHYLDQVLDPLGRRGVRTEYDAQGRLTRLIDANDQAVQLSNDPDRQIQTIRDPLGNPTTLEYDARGNLVTTIDARNGVTRRTYDLDNNLLSVTDPERNVRSFTYDASGNTTSQTDALGNVTRYTFSPQGRQLTMTDALGNTTSNRYDARGNLTASVNPDGKTTTYTRDAAGRPTAVTDRRGGVLRLEYDGRGNVVRQTDPLGHVTVFTYDGNGNLLTEATTVTTPTGPRTLTTTTAYDAKGRVLSVTDPEGGIRRNEYDAAGNLVARVDALNRRTAYRYDSRDQLVETRYADNTFTEITYNEANQRVATTDRARRVTRYVYDTLGRLVETILPDDTPADLSNNPRTRLESDAAGRKTAQVDERGNRTEFVVDAVGRPTVVRDARQGEKRTTYDAAGNVTAQTDALNHVTRFVYDALNRPVQTLFADGTRISAAYDAAGNRVSQTDQAGRTTRFEYDALGRLTAVVDVLNGRSEYGYDEVGNLVRQQDANRHVTRYEYDGVSRRTATVLPLGQRAVQTYDLAGNLTRRTDFNNATVNFEYDRDNRLTARRYPDGSFIEFTYTPTGKPETVTDARGVTRYTYDARDRLVSRAEPDGRTIRYGYDAAGNRTSLIVPSGTTSYTYDNLNRMETVTDPSLGVTRYTYDAASNLVRTERPNSTVSTRTYDDLNRLTFLEDRGPAGVLASFRYTLGLNGQRSAVEEAGGRRVNYGYDALNRLVTESIVDPAAGNRTVGYTYDAAGNRLTRDDSVEGLTTYGYDDNDRLLTETLAGVTTRYTYDANGNTLTRDKGPADRATYAWDFDNRLTRAEVTSAGGTKQLTYRYDANGIRVSATVDGQETRYLVDGNRQFAEVLEEYTPAGGVAASYVHGLDLISQTRGGQRSFYHVDGLGSTRALTNPAGAVTDRYVYDAFGRTLSQTGTTVNVYQFAGEQRDANLGLDYLRARYVQPTTGRFLGTDPADSVLSQPWTLHRYVYAWNDPVNKIDPGGEFGFSIAGVMAPVTLSHIIGVAWPTVAKGVTMALIIKFVMGPGFKMRNTGLELIGAGAVEEGSALYQQGNALIGLGANLIAVTSDLIDWIDIAAGGVQILRGLINSPRVLSGVRVTTLTYEEIQELIVVSENFLAVIQRFRGIRITFIEPQFIRDIGEALLDVVDTAADVVNKIIEGIYS